MKSAKLNALLPIFLLTLIAALVYLPFVSQFGYYNDDWYLMFAAGAKGASVFHDIFAIDRPLRVLVMIPAWTLFGNNPLYYNLSAFFFRLISGLSFYWLLRLIWKDRQWETLSAALLFLIYPGFLAQPNAIDYQSHIVGLAAGMTSIALTIKAIQSDALSRKIFFYFASILTGWLYLGQMEWYIGLEFLRFGCILVIGKELNTKDTKYTKGDGRVSFVTFVSFMFKNALPVVLIPVGFLTWRLFYFQSERGATDVNLQLGEARAAPLTYLLKWTSSLLNDVADVFFRAWFVPLQRLTYNVSPIEWLIGVTIATLALTATWLLLTTSKTSNTSKTSKTFIPLGIGLLLFGLLPVILVGREVDFKSFSRYSIIASVGVALIWTAALSFISNLYARNILLSFFILSATLTHYANGLAHARSTQATRDFWRQVSWRIPQLERGTTLVAHYSAAAEEDYFTWGPANLIYYPESLHADYVQPTIYAALLSEDTVSKTVAHEPQDFSNRRGIRTYKNYRNLLVLTQPTPDSCMQVVDMNQIELSANEDPRVVALAPYSETEHILLNESFHTPPVIPFGAEPQLHTWCFYYEKAAYSRQAKNWDEIIRLDEDARVLGLTAKDPVELIPFLEAYARADNFPRVEELAPFITTDKNLSHQVCQTLQNARLSPAMRTLVNRFFC